MIQAKDRILVALDTPDVAKAQSLSRQLQGHVGGIKLGLEFFNASGQDGVRQVVHGDDAQTPRGQSTPNQPLSLDLKFHDIPAQVEGACRAAAQLGVGLLTVHASGGRAMLEAAARGAAEGSAGFDEATRVLAVTILTSLDQSDLDDLGIGRSVNDQVLALAQLARDAGCGGVVASPKELPLLRPELAAPFGILTPGIRPAGAAVGDQKRVTTPADAVRGGADWLVVGRPIRNAESRVEAARAILDEMAGAV